MMKFFRKIRSTTRIAFALALIVASVMWCTFGFGFFGNLEKSVTDQRVHLCETIAVSVAGLISEGRDDQVEPFIR